MQQIIKKIPQITSKTPQNVLKIVKNTLQSAYFPYLPAHTRDWLRGIRRHPRNEPHLFIVSWHIV
jgi:hypothetical protein